MDTTISTTAPPDAHGVAAAPPRGRSAADVRNPAATPAAGECGLSIQVEARGDVNIHHHCAAPAPCPASPDSADGHPPKAEGNTCLPPMAGSKHKQSPAQKFAARAARVRVPSALAASTMHLVRRFLAGQAPAHELESRVFAKLASLPAAARATLACASARLDALPAAQRVALFDPALGGGTGALSPQDIAAAFGREIAARAGAAAFGNAEVPHEERPGRIRIFEPSPEDFFSQVRICAVNGLRSDDFIPRLAAGEYSPAEIAQDCNTVLVDGQPQVVCQVRTGNCVGGGVGGEGGGVGGGVCLRVPTVAAGNGVLLQGVNFFSTDAHVQLTARAPGTATRLLDAFVVGDLDTPVTETVEGQTRIVNDCRVHDRLSFIVPADLPPGLYETQVVLPNITGIAAFGERLLSNSEVIEVLPPPTARFQISLETLLCRRETAPGWIGSDEVGLRLLAVPLLADLSVGAAQVSGRRFGDVDSGESRNLGQLLFDQRQAIAAVALAVIGHEVDGEEAYQQRVTAVTDLFIDLVKEQAEFIKDSLKEIGIGASQLAQLGGTGFVVVAIAAALLLAIDLVVALWAPADLLIEDPAGYTLLDLVERTGASFPMPPPSAFTTEGDIVVTVKPLDKRPQQYREAREYASSAEDSRYEITYRFNRVA